MLILKILGGVLALAVGIYMGRPGKFEQTPEQIEESLGVRRASRKAQRYFTPLDWLKANQPEDEPTVLCWGDARIGNIIFNQACDGVAAVLDWEMAVLGNPVQDLAWFNYIDATFAEGLGMPRLPGLPSYADTVSRWEAASGFAAPDYDYYWIFAGMRYGLILSRIMLSTGQESEIETNFACQLLRKYLDEKA